MIARLVGHLVGRDGNRAILDVRDVGYEVWGPARDVERWARAEEAVVVWVSTQVREDAITLFGFSTDADRVAFERLREVNGVGPKLALAALDTLGLDGLGKAIAGDDVTSLARIPGVGKKLAQRLALELKGKLVGTFEVADLPAAPPKRAPQDDQLDLALARLGYTRTEIVRAHKGLEAEGVPLDAPVAERLRASLRILSGG
ncbi:MAG: Holliday junction branch migration protein RuvA [Alphaproteobacteria bacterium]|nr:Holliday junction branch migration protein RuvA [Alphaproteobacteria bacterium]